MPCSVTTSPISMKTCRKDHRWCKNGNTALSSLLFVCIQKKSSLTGAKYCCFSGSDKDHLRDVARLSVFRPSPQLFAATPQVFAAALSLNHDLLNACARIMDALHMCYVSASACCTSFCRSTRFCNADNEPWNFLAACLHLPIAFLPLLLLPFAVVLLLVLQRSIESHVTVGEGVVMFLLPRMLHVTPLLHSVLSVSCLCVQPLHQCAWRNDRNECNAGTLLGMPNIPI